MRTELTARPARQKAQRRQTQPPAWLGVAWLNPDSVCFRHTAIGWRSPIRVQPIKQICVSSRISVRVQIKYGRKLVGVAGFEPATPTSRTWCATRLHYTALQSAEAADDFQSDGFSREPRSATENTASRHKTAAIAHSRNSPRLQSMPFVPWSLVWFISQLPSAELIVPFAKFRANRHWSRIIRRS